MKKVAIRILCLLMASLVAGAVLLLLALLMQFMTNDTFPTYHEIMVTLAITLVFSPAFGIAIGLPVLVVVERFIPLKRAFKLFVLIGLIVGGGVEVFVAYSQSVPTIGLLAGAAGGASLWWFLQLSERLSDRAPPRV